MWASLVRTTPPKTAERGITPLLQAGLVARVRKLAGMRRVSKRFLSEWEKLSVRLRNQEEIVINPRRNFLCQQSYNNPRT